MDALQDAASGVASEMLNRRYTVHPWVLADGRRAATANRCTRQLKCSPEDDGTVTSRWPQKRALV